MSAQVRALLIGILGPSIGGIGLAWVFARSLIVDPGGSTFRSFLFDAPHLLLAVGIVVSFVCLPVAVEVALASPEDAEIPIFEADEESEQEIANNTRHELKPIAK